MKTIATTLTLVLSASAALAEPAGLRLLDLDLPHHGERAGAAIWYPNGGGGETTLFAENAVFHGVDAVTGAELAEGTHPLILFSHGMGGTHQAQAWLAEDLARRGAIVVAVSHPNSTWRDFDMRKGVRHWTRVADLNVALDAVLGDADFVERVDRSRIMAAGFSYGGWTALSMGGVTGNHAGIVAGCEAHVDTMSACDMLLSEEVNMQGLDPAEWNGAYGDPRITHVAAIDPGFVWGLAPSDVAGLASEVLIVGLGDAGTRMLATDFDRSGLAAMLPDAKIARLAPAFHFTAMPICKPEGEAILVAEADDPVCTDPAGTDRAAIHAEIADLMAAELDL
ncbi:hypothetical protein MWU52_07865 [Jannaschia sp. S6380]|uniref:alpha/beta hydrolase family protein n=1 Tax=Jannaschia sp. S6380 TaxID=2926408 RepID=UPI001FF20BD7|nr:hypothetical protein [Jannaschia sp. S6380]MCK0167459.1 hypothetical protein [Jannaschia sp. S6380]